MAKYTAEDVKYLADCIRNSKSPNNKPFAFLLGAGVSKSAGIPLASELVDEINKSPHLNLHLFGMNEEDRKSYPKCMARLTVEDRRALLDPYLKNAKVNWSGLALATLLKAADKPEEGSYIKRLLTFNFDNVLARACGICGYYPATYDFSVEPPSDFQFMSEGSIVHLHGQGSGLVMLNSEEDTRIHAEKLKALYIDTLANFNLVVIGYSGEADSSFSQFARIFNGRTRLFWIGHSEAPADHIQQLIAKAPGTSRYYGDADADKFLMELAKHFSCWPPQVLMSPETHLLAELDPVMPYPTPTGSDDLLNSIRKELRKAATKRKNQTGNFEQLLLQGKYDELVNKVDNATTDKQKSAVAWAYVMQGNALLDQAIAANSEVFFQQSIQKYQEALRIRPDMHEALNSWGVALRNLAKFKSDETLYHDSIAKYEAAHKMKPGEHKILNNWGTAIQDLANLKNNEPLYSDCFAKYDAALKIKPDYYQALNNWGAGLQNLAMLKGDETLYRESFTKYNAVLKIKPDHYDALNNWGIAIQRVAKLKDDEALYRESIAKYDAALKIKPDYYEAIHNWGNALHDIAVLKSDETLYRESIAKYEAVLMIKSDYFEALNSWGAALQNLAMLKGDETLYRESFAKYDAFIKIKPDDYGALSNWGTALQRLAKMNDDEALYYESIAKYDAALKIKPDCHEALDGWGSALLLLFHLTQDQALLQKAAEVCAKAEKFSSKSNYNLACVFALQSFEEKCREQLLRCQSAGTLPKKKHLESDIDLAAYQEQKWFKNLLKE